MSMKNPVLALLVALPLLTSCAAMFGTSPSPAKITSDPPGATVIYRGTPVGVTPCDVKMKHNNSVLTLRMDGFHEREADLGSQSNGGLIFFGFFLWGPLELLFDAAADAWSCTDTRPFSIELAPVAGPYMATKQRKVDVPSRPSPRKSRRFGRGY